MSDSLREDVLVASESMSTLVVITRFATHLTRISSSCFAFLNFERLREIFTLDNVRLIMPAARAAGRSSGRLIVRSSAPATETAKVLVIVPATSKIGRASCRERV